MRQLTCVEAGKLEWRDVPEPRIEADCEALIRPLAVARCDIDRFLVSGAFPIQVPFALGHECVAIVTALGDSVRGLSLGQRVVVSFQVSCGRCGRCRAGLTALCEEMPVLSDYGMQPLSGVEYGGMLSDLVRVPFAEAMLRPISPTLDPAALASVSDNVPDGYRAVAPHLAARPGSEVLVVSHGAPSIPLFPIVVDAGVTPAGLGWAIRATEPEGIYQCVSFYPGPPLPLPLGRMYTLGIRCCFGRCHAAALLPEVVDLIEAGRLRPEAVTTRIVDWDAAADAWPAPAIKLVVRRSG
jgi:threonine dehydrogenase-like Zn-dependent dehydrogenase